ncbi:MAG: MmgE/PrpD family protein [Duodenibacillus sp.]|nr:MmgE/PrpD family protein [Duodenibacillus sp.]
MQEPIQAALAEFVAGCDLARIGEHFKEDARYRILDWIGCAAAGAHYPQVEIASKYLDQVGDAGPCTVVGSDKTRSVRAAAMLNGIAGHVCELDDGHRTAIGHPGSVALPVALAVGEAVNASGADVLKAVILGYDMFSRTGRAVNPSHYRCWHTTGTCGTLAACAAAASLLKLDAEQANNALGTACTLSGGLVESFGSHAKALNIGAACQNGVDAAMLAKAGFTGSHSALLGKKGFVAATCADPHVSHLENPSEATLISDTAFYKVYSSCGHTNSPLDMTFRLKREHAVDPAAIESVLVKTYKVSVDLTSQLKVATEDEAKFSLPFCIAIALLKGSVTLANFSEAVRTDPEVLALARRIQVVEDPEATARFPARQAEVTIAFKDGASISAKTLSACDEAEPAQIIAKFEDAVPFYSPEKRKAIVDMVTRIEDLPNIKLLTAMLA